MQEINWEEFYQITKDHPPWPLLVQAVSLLGRVGEALDLGCGAGRDTRYLLAQGFEVTAVDREAASLAVLSELSSERLRCVQSSFEDFVFEQYYLINAHFALHFIQKDHFPIVFSRIKVALKPSGIFVGQFFGIKDTWNVPETTMTFYTPEQARELLAGLDIVEFQEEDKDGEMADGTQKHWHVYHIIARKPRGDVPLE